MADPVQVQQDSKYRVAFELMQKISQVSGTPAPTDAEYWLRLYSSCLHVMNNSSADEAVRKLPKS